MPPETSRFLDQIAAAEFLQRECGIRIAAKTLQKARVTGVRCSPFRKILGRVVYERAALMEWGEAQRSPLVTSTSELPKQPA